MLNFKQTNILFTMTLLVSVIFYIYLPFPLIWIAVPFSIYLLLLIRGSKNICSQFYLKTKCKSEDKSQIHLTFDDGPNPFTTPKILEVLKIYDKKATFFCIGEKIEKNPEVFMQIFEAGHEIGNHSYSHSYFFDFYRSSRVKNELEKTSHLIKNITGKAPIYFRPPFGVTNPNIARALKNLKMEVIGWSIKSKDTFINKKRVLNRINKAKPGDIILFHDTKERTVEILDVFLRLSNNNKL